MTQVLMVPKRLDCDEMLADLQLLCLHHLMSSIALVTSSDVYSFSYFQGIFAMFNISYSNICMLSKSRATTTSSSFPSSSSSLKLSHVPGSS